MYISQRAIKKSFCGAFFKKRQRKTALFFLRSFFFCASCVKRKSDRMKAMSLSINAECTKNPTLAVILSGAKRSRTFFVLDPKCRYAPFAPHCVRSSTALRMTRTKKRRAKQGGIYEQLAHNVRTLIFHFHFFNT